MIGVANSGSGCIRPVNTLQRVQYALLNLAEAAAEKQEFETAATFAERAYTLPGLGGTEITSLKRLYTLLCAGKGLLAPEVRKEAESYGVIVQLMTEEARATFKEKKRQALCQYVVHRLLDEMSNSPN